MDGLLGVMHDLVADGNSVVVVDHDVRVLKAADHLIEMGPVAGAEGGHVIAQGTVGEVAANPSSRIAPFLADNVSARIRERVAEPQVFDLGRIRMTTSQLHTVKPLDVDIPRGRLVAVTGVSGSGKTTMVLESLIPALKAQAAGSGCRNMCVNLRPRASIVRISSTPRRLAQTYAPPWPPMPIFTTNCAAPSPARTAPRRAAGRLAISHTTPADCVAPHATAPVQSRSMCSSCRT